MRIIGFIFISLFSLAASAEEICGQSMQPDEPVKRGDVTIRAIAENAKNDGPQCMVEGRRLDQTTTCQTVEMIDGKVVCTRGGLSFLPATVKIELGCRGDEVDAEYSYESRSGKKIALHKIVIRKNDSGGVKQVDQYDLSWEKPSIIRAKYFFDQNGKYFSKEEFSDGEKVVKKRNASGTIKEFARWSGYDAAGIASCCEDSSQDRCADLMSSVSVTAPPPPPPPSSAPAAATKSSAPEAVTVTPPAPIRATIIKKAVQ